MLYAPRLGFTGLLCEGALEYLCVYSCLTFKHIILVVKFPLDPVGLEKSTAKANKTPFEHVPLALRPIPPPAGTSSPKGNHFINVALHELIRCAEKPCRLLAIHSCRASMTAARL